METKGKKTYQDRAMAFCMESSNNMPYMAFGGFAEFGELFEKLVEANQIVADERVKQAIALCKEFGALAKMIRKGECDYPMPTEYVIENVEIARELGDICWFGAGIAHVAGWRTENIEDMNIDKLTVRAENNCIEGEGDGDIR